MSAPSILTRPELAILRRLDADQLARIRPRVAERGQGLTCPMAQALGIGIGGGWHLAILLNERAPSHEALGSGAFRALKSEAKSFVESWDYGDTSIEDLEAAVAAALAQKGGVR